jgi:DNA-binding MarR family transcriptional regulator
MRYANDEKPMIKGDLDTMTPTYDCLQREAHLNLARTSAVLDHRLADVFRAEGITPTQFNVLRILRTAGDRGLCRNAIRDRLVSQVPDATRLLDRMEALGLVTRTRSASDRRMITTRITDKGLEMVDRIDRPVAEAHRSLLDHMSNDELQTLIALLVKARERETGRARSGENEGAEKKSAEGV